jgi:FixJ family two-component response regulator
VKASAFGRPRGKVLVQASLVSIIDDDDSLREALMGLVRSIGRRAVGYRTADAFLAANGQAHSACIVTDIHMPGISGIALTQRLAAIGCAAPVILITARGEPDLRARAAAAGAHCLLIKPFAADALIACVETALARRARPA